jgi:hypothetical protein
VGYVILEEHIKPLFTAQHTFSRHVNPTTGRKIQRQQEHLFGPASDSLDEPVWKLEGMGFWNAMSLLLARLHEVHHSRRHRREREETFLFLC